MAHSVIDGSHVAEICSYKTHTSTVIHIVRLVICRDSAAQDDSPLPLTVLTSCYLCLASLIWKFRKRFRTLTCFSLLPTTSFIGLIRISVLNIFQNFVEAARFVVVAMQPLAIQWLGPVSISALAREMDFLGLSKKSQANTAHIFIWSLIPLRKALFTTLPLCSKLLTHPPNAIIRRSHTIGGHV